MGSLTSPPRVERLYIGSRDRRSFAGLAVHGRATAANAAISEALAFLRQAEAAGLDLAFRLDFARGLHDALGDLAGRNARDLDAEHLDPTLYPIDRAELDEKIGKLEAEASR